MLSNYFHSKNMYHFLYLNTIISKRGKELYNTEEINQRQSAS